MAGGQSRGDSTEGPDYHGPVWWIFTVTWACEQWGSPTTLAPLEAPGLTESSGIAPSRRTPGLLWTHDDSGNAELFRFGLDGTVSIHTVPGADNADWEDIASAPCGNRDACLYIGDIGAERGDPGTIRVFVVREPRGEETARLLERWELHWPEEPRDAETLLVHPCTQEAWIVTRGTPTEVFAIDPDRGPTPTLLERVAVLGVGPITGGDVAPDGSAVVLRSLEEAWRWPVGSDGRVDWAAAPERVARGLEPGEAITWEPDGDLILTSEGSPMPVGRIPCVVPSDTPVCVAERCGCHSAGPTLPWWGRR